MNQVDISLAQWSHNKAFFGRGGAEKKDPLKFAEIAKKEGIEGRSRAGERVARV